jgi:hypothetical protein
MSQRTEASLARLDELAPLLDKLPKSASVETLIEDSQALRRAVAAFHMEAIRFRMYNVDRGLKLVGDPPDARRLYEALRDALETAGFHTRSHSAP